MAKFSFSLPEDFLLKISTLADKTDEIIPKILGAGAEVVLVKVKSNLVSVVGRNTKHESRSTGQLVSALGITPAKQDSAGNFNVKVGFSENRSDGVSNAMLANFIEYGRSNQASKPFLKPARSTSRKACIEAMKNKFESEINS